jgi:ATP-dependent DNA helicase RecG
MRRQQGFPSPSPRRCPPAQSADPPTISPEGAAWRGSPMTNSSPARSRWRWCARGSKRRRPSAVGDGDRRRDARALPYSLTRSRRGRIAEIDADLAKPERMLRLLQGDVGSGKTVVALLAMARAEAGGRRR